jgi:hypothetical protein
MQAEAKTRVTTKDVEKVLKIKDEIASEMPAPGMYV